MLRKIKNITSPVVKVAFILAYYDVFVTFFFIHPDAEDDAEKIEFKNMGHHSCLDVKV